MEIQSQGEILAREIECKNRDILKLRHRKTHSKYHLKYAISILLPFNIAD
jgi:hypothetical protein